MPDLVTEHVPHVWSMCLKGKLHDIHQKQLKRIGKAVDLA